MVKTALIALFISFVFSLSSKGSSQASGVSVIVDSETFSRTESPVFQRFADLTAAAINGMIPGVPNGYAQPTIVVFAEGPQFQAANHLAVPLTLVGPKLVGEPSATKAGTIRIGVVVVAGPDIKRFMFQLSHELTHVKMGAEVDNTLLESLASMMSHEVVARMHFYDYLVASITPEVMKLPPDVQRAYADINFAALRPYWQSRCAAQWYKTGDIGCEVIGSMLLKSHQPRGSLLLNIGQYTLPLPPSKGYGTQLRPPDIPALKRAGFPVEALGY